MGTGLALALLVGCLRVALPQAPPALDPDLVQRGALLFLDSGLSGDGTRSCNGCHPGGGSDGKVYLGAREVAPGTPGGRNTPALFGSWQTPPYFWDGSADTLGTALDRMLAQEMLGGEPGPRDREALLAYLGSLAPFDRGRVERDGTPVEPATRSAREGRAVYVRAGCPTCHAAPAYAHRFLFDVGTGSKLNPPTLRGVSTTAPYGHDGRWKTLEDAVVAILEAREVRLEHRELRQLLAYLKLL